MWLCRPLPSLLADLKVKVDSLTAHHQNKSYRDLALFFNKEVFSVYGQFIQKRLTAVNVCWWETGGRKGVGEKNFSLSEIYNEKMLTLCDCSMAKQWSIKTNLEERDREKLMWNRLRTASDRKWKERGYLMLRDELWYCTERRESWEISFLCSLDMWKHVHLLYSYIYIMVWLSCLSSIWSLADMTLISRVWDPVGQLCPYFFSVLFSYLRCIEASRLNKTASKEVNYSTVWGS